MRLIHNFAALVAAYATGAEADMYLMNPRGSNNRYNEANNNRNNGNRLFDSQNNNAGGYNAGPPMYYYVGSKMTMEWTNQHGSGIDQENVHDEVIIQYACEDTMPGLRNGASTQTNPDPEPEPPMLKYGQHETYQWYADCKVRQRNKGLFTADQKLKGNSARFTRQNPNGQRRGYECPEERDYYPYWHPTPWKDIVIMTGAKEWESRCMYYLNESQNDRAKGYCSLPEYNNEKDCEFEDPDAPPEIDPETQEPIGPGTWTMAGRHGIDKPLCYPSQPSRDNHHGNGVDGHMNSFNWTIPDDPHKNCVVRIRYNISTGDYDGWNGNITAYNNNDDSIIENNPELEYFYGLQLALNTAQTGRTFQDRSHVFEIRSRPADVAAETRIHNINVRGKRGNIVQVYPGVEYDFVPQRALVYPGDLVHFQWTGSNNNPNGNDGEGTAGTDRSNVIQIADASVNYPLKVTDSDSDMFAMNTGLMHQHALLINSEGGQLNEAGTYFDGGLVRMTDNEEGATYHYMSSRNNNFSNRSQKGVIVVSTEACTAEGYNRGGGKYYDEVPCDDNNGVNWAVVGAAVGGTVAAAGAAAGGFFMWKKGALGGGAASAGSAATAATPALPPRM